GEIVAVGAELIRIEIDTADGATGARGTAVDNATQSLGGKAGSESSTASPSGTASPTMPLAPSPATGADQDSAVRLADATASGNRPLASPAVRRHARELDLDLHQIAGSGPDGRITHDDVEAAARRARPQPAPTYVPQKEGTRVTRLTGLR